MPDLSNDEEITKASYDADAENWAKYFDSHGGWPEELAKFKELLPSGKILDIGAGTGRDAKDLIKLGYEYTGADVSEELLKIARKRLPGQKFIHQSVYELDFPDKFDGFWASAILLHVPKSRIDEALQKIKSVTRPGAIGFISVKDGAGEQLTEHRFRDKEENLKRMFVYWSKGDFENVLNKNGFKVLDYTYRPISEKTKWHIYIVKNK
jgi:ubiquinone/menaquinone biosynthesis C-methylase UbiE